VINLICVEILSILLCLEQEAREILQFNRLGSIFPRQAIFVNFQRLRRHDSILTYLPLFIRVHCQLAHSKHFATIGITSMKACIKMFILLCFVSLFITRGPILVVYAEDEISKHSESSSSEEVRGFNPAQWLLSIYRDHISPVNGDRCPSFPSCSSYAEQAMKKHGFFIGWMMTVDRLIHEGKEETSVSPYIKSDGEVLIFDPVENNDFWWYPRHGKDHE
jgi:hypothetical protein